MPDLNYKKLVIYASIAFVAWVLLPTWIFAVIAISATAGMIVSRPKAKPLASRWNPEQGTFD